MKMWGCKIQALDTWVKRGKTWDLTWRWGKNDVKIFANSIQHKWYHVNSVKTWTSSLVETNLENCLLNLPLPAALQSPLVSLSTLFSCPSCIFYVLFTLTVSSCTIFWPQPKLLGERRWKKKQDLLCKTKHQTETARLYLMNTVKCLVDKDPNISPR